MVLQLTWPYGTLRDVVVVKQARVGEGEILVVQDEEDAREAYVLLQDRGPAYAVGLRGRIEFMKGGPTGGYWQFTALESAP